MKKILIALVVVLCSVQLAGAQGKSPETIKKNIDSAESDTANPKKAENVATWIKLGNVYIEAYENPRGDGIIGVNRQLVNTTDKPTSTEEVSLSGVYYTKDIFPTRNYYYDEQGNLRIIEVTQPICEDALMKAAEAFTKAYEVDVKATKTMDIARAIDRISSKFQEEAFQKYSLGDLEGACECFEKAFTTKELAPLSEVDSLSIYNAGFTASAIGNLEKAKTYFERSRDIGYYEDGETFGRLGDLYSKLGDPDKAIEVLEEGFVLFPENQAILVGLIGLYISNNREPDKLFGYIAQAKANEPNNASLYYVEGDIYKNLGDTEKALASYDEASKVNPEYEFGYIGSALIYLNEFEELRNQAIAEEDDTKYYALVDQFIQCLIKSGELFERAYEVTVNMELKGQLAEQLRSIYFQLRDQDPKFMAAYEKYNAIAAGQ